MSRVSRPLGYQQLNVTTGAAATLTIPRGALFATIYVMGAPVRLRDDGTAPTSSVGQLVQPGTVIPVVSNLVQFQAIAVGSAAVLDICYYDDTPEGSGIPIPTSPFGIADSLAQGGTAAAPGAGANFVSRAAPPIGIYRILGNYIITGALEVAAQNVRLLVNNAGLVDLPTNVLNVLIPFEIPRVALDGANVVALRAVANATAATVYTGSLSCTRIG
jgi:hypothetical protein